MENKKMFKMAVIAAIGGIMFVCYGNEHNFSGTIKPNSELTPNITESDNEAAFNIPSIRIADEWRKIIRYEHESAPQWGYPKPQKDFFNLLPPQDPGKKSPLIVVLHSSGGTGNEAIPAICQPHDRGFYGDKTFYVLCLDCSTNTNRIDGWWGYRTIESRPELYKDKLCPTEERALSTIEWVIRTFNIDRNRVYLNGISMGGSGSLGIGMTRGDLFAAVSVVVPAGVKHAIWRTSNSKFPDPPPLFNISSQVDPWALGQEDLLTLCRENKYFLSFAWGPFDHRANVSSANPAAYEYPWLSIRKDEAYPVFTNASTDDRYPGFKNSTDADQTGQINGYFRWKNIEDTPEVFVMELRLVKKDELRRPLETPQKSLADVTIRRLQKFVVSPGVTYEWKMIQGEKTMQSGKAVADAAGILTIPAVIITDIPSCLKFVRCAQTLSKKENSMKVLFLGNSQMKVYNLPLMVQSMSESAPPDHIRITAGNMAVNGMSLKKHWDAGEAPGTPREVIANGKWDCVILQEIVYLNNMEFSKFEEEFQKYAGLFDSAIKAAGAKTILFATATATRYYKAGSYRLDSFRYPDSFIAINEMQISYGKKKGIPVAAAGYAWMKYLGPNPSEEQILSLYHEDRGHPGLYGTYIYACLLYAFLTGKTPVGLASEFEFLTPGVIPPREALKLQQAAWEQYLESTKP